MQALLIALAIIAGVVLLFFILVFFENNEEAITSCSARIFGAIVVVVGLAVTVGGAESNSVIQCLIGVVALLIGALMFWAGGLKD